MAQYDVIYKCGHKRVIKLYGPGDERRKKLDYLGRQLCIKCEAAKIAAEEQGDLPALTGSEKQIAWATTIRHDLFPQIEEAAKEAMRRIDEFRCAAEDNLTDLCKLAEKTQEQMRQLIDAYAAKSTLNTQISQYNEAKNATEAKWWIDHRCLSGKIKHFVAMSTTDIRDFCAWLYKHK